MAESGNPALGLPWPRPKFPSIFSLKLPMIYSPRLGGAMEKEKKKKADTGKILSEFKIRLKLLEFLAFVESVKRFELTNGRKPTRDERKNIAKTSHINLDVLCIDREFLLG